MDRYGRWENGFSRHFLGTIVICMVRLSSLSLIQNRADDFCTSYAHLRRKRLREKPSFSINPSLQVRATVPASTCRKKTIRLHLGISSLHVFLLSHNLIIIVYYLSRLIPFASNQTQHEMMISCHEMMVLWHEMMISCHEMTTLMDGWAWYPH